MRYVEMLLLLNIKIKREKCTLKKSYFGGIKSKHFTQRHIKFQFRADLGKNSVHQIYRRKDYIERRDLFKKRFCRSKHRKVKYTNKKFSESFIYKNRNLVFLMRKINYFHGLEPFFFV